MPTVWKNRLLIAFPALVALLAFKVGAMPQPLAPLLLMCGVAVALSHFIQSAFGFYYLYPGCYMLLPSLVAFWGGLPMATANLNSGYANIAIVAFFLHLLFVLNTTRTQLTPSRWH